MDDLNDMEKAILTYLYNHMENVIMLSDGYVNILGETFNSNDLYRLYDKLGISDLVD